MRTLREVLSIGATAWEVTRGRYIDDPDRRRLIARVQADRLRALRDADAADRACADACTRIMEAEFQRIAENDIAVLEILANDLSGWGG